MRGLISRAIQVQYKEQEGEIGRMAVFAGPCKISSLVVREEEREKRDK